MTRSTNSTSAPRPARRNARRARAGGGALLAVLLTGSAALAEPSPRDRAQAEVLFRAGRQLVSKGDLAAGCPKFEESFALYPAASTKLNLARCHEQADELVLAWRAYREALTLVGDVTPESRRKELSEIAHAGLAALDARLAKLRIVIPTPPGALKVLRDGALVPASELGEASPVEPGRHEVSASAPGHPTVTRAVVAEAGKTATVELSLEPMEQRSPEVPAWVWITGGAGVALTGVGVYFLGTDLAAISDLRANCHEDGGKTYCAPGYDHERDNARKNRGLGLFLGLGGAGAVAIGAAVVGLLKVPSTSAPGSREAALTVSPWVAPGGGGTSISGAF
ncbi:hypothetical protein SOCEGT47_034690 [Sorangium cellulosum]|uniref:PEGA domain-containing protein n=1 Tax=Sorangium cellulosum TaxID=56 RepID=A0A4P2Q287_SORCE|nr:hypothetical protein [Sorangium cellulosum]AUX22953.1 hypothetical protein SOCEGT47_034690 [Sorangium cellulosum]